MTTAITLEDREVTVDFNVIPGERRITSGPADNWSEGSDPEVEVESMVFDDGEDAMHLYAKFQPEVDLTCIESYESLMGDEP